MDPTPTDPADVPAPPTASSPAEQFRRAFAREHATTMRVLRAFPADRADFRPHDRSNSAQQLAWTFVVEEHMMRLALDGARIVGGDFPRPPDTWDGLLAALDAARDEVLRRLDDPARARLDGVVQFFTGPGEVGDYATGDFLWFLLHDQIHHRGQLSVYVRMAGGRVPSIYGPSADEPWG